jgi:hypothetical protein
VKISTTPAWVPLGSAKFDSLGSVALHEVMRVAAGLMKKVLACDCVLAPLPMEIS